MSNPTHEDLLRAATRSLCVHWGTNAPYSIGRVSAERIGYAQTPCVVVTATCRGEDVDVLVPILRQRVFGELAERGWGDEHIAFRPTVQRGRRRKFVDDNTASASHGRDKFGIEHRYSFEMDRDLARATFAGHGTYAPLTTRARADV